MNTHSGLPLRGGIRTHQRGVILPLIAVSRRLCRHAVLQHGYNSVEKGTDGTHIKDIITQLSEAARQRAITAIVTYMRIAFSVCGSLSISAIASRGRDGCGDSPVSEQTSDQRQRPHNMRLRVRGVSTRRSDWSHLEQTLIAYDDTC